MVVLNDIDRFHLVIDVIDRVPGLGERGRRSCARRWSTRGCAHRAYTREHGEDLARDRRLDAGRTRGRERPRDRCGCSSSTPDRAASSSRLLGDGDETWPRSEFAPSRAAAVDLASSPGRSRGEPAARTRSGTGSCTAASGLRARSGSTTTSSTPCARSPRSPRCTSRGAGRARAVAGARCPACRAVACFDTAFHATMPAGGRDVRAARRWRGALGAAPLRLPRAVPRLRRPAGAELPGVAGDGLRNGQRAPRGGRVAVRGRRR